MKTEASLPIYQKQVVFIFDECHRSQFGEAQKNLRKKFKYFYQFGFTGTPIFPENALGAETTQSVFGTELHSYVITDAIRDEKVLKFKVDYTDVRPRFKAFELEQDEQKLSAAEHKEALLHPERIREIARYILNSYKQKTHRLLANGTGFNAMFAVSSVDAAKIYYETFRNLQKGTEKPLTIATIFSFAANEEQNAVGEIIDEGFELTAMDSSAKEFLNAAITDYNVMFKTNFSTESNGFQNTTEICLLASRNRKLTFLLLWVCSLPDSMPYAQHFVCRQESSLSWPDSSLFRTNRIYDATKTFGNIVTFETWNRRPLTQLPYSATRTRRTWFWKRATRNIWRVLPILLPVKPVGGIWMS